MKSKTDKEVTESSCFGKDIENVIYSIYFFPFYLFLIFPCFSSSMTPTLLIKK